MSINKLVYFALEHVLLKRGKLITRAKVEAWNHGPVFRELYQDFRKHGDEPITSRAEIYSVQSGTKERAVANFSRDEELDILEAVEALIHLPACTLRELSHTPGGAWDRVWRYDGYANPGMEITPQIIRLAAAREGAR